MKQKRNSSTSRSDLLEEEKKEIRNKHFEKFWLISIPLLCVLLLFLLALLLFFPTIKLKGEKEIVIEVGTKYKDKGFSAYYFGHNLTGKVKVSGEVNYKKLGKYNITYKVGNGFFTTSKKRTVIVSDKEKPDIDLFGDKTFYVCPGSEYKEPGYRAFDSFDGNLTRKVKVKNSLNKVVYSVRDKSHNLRRVTRKLIYKDIEGPVIKLNGGDITYAFVGEEYHDPGYEVIDNCDKNLNDKVDVSGDVDASKPGTYTVTYKVSDKEGNESEVKRTVIVARRGQNGTVYLTFDDGPQSGTTNIILDILRDNGVKATFFVTSKGPDELIKREYDEGHTVGLHTSTHDYSYVYSSHDAYFEDLNTVKKRVDSITGQDSKIIRFPGGSSNTISRKYVPGLMTDLTDSVIREGYRYFDWNINSGDAGDFRDPDSIVRRVTNSLSKDRVNIILMHDIKPYTRDALDRIIKYGKENGFIFDKITMDTEMMHQRVNN